MEHIMEVAKGDSSLCPQAEKLLYETGIMMQTPPSHWSCGCEIAYTLYQKQDHTFNTVTAGPDDYMVPYVFMVRHFRMPADLCAPLTVCHDGCMASRF